VAAQTDLNEAKILIVDDTLANVRLLECILNNVGYTRLISTTNPAQVAGIYTELQPDLILLDLRMPQLDGFAVMRQLEKLIPDENYVPILMLTADASPEAKQRALSAGAKDFLTKPFDPVEVVLRIKNLLETRLLHNHLQQHNETLEAMVRARTQDLEQAQLEVLERLARAAEYRDDDTGQHTQRVGQLAALLGQELGLTHDEVVLLRRAAPLHDVGKIGISDTVLLKPGRLTAEEFAHMQAHTTIGANILSGSGFPVLQLAEEIALTHHERWDGAGYPHGLAGTEIPLPGRIVAVADVFDALTHNRPYKRAWSIEEARTEIAQQKGRQFDPDVVQAFVSILARTGIEHWERVDSSLTSSVFA